MFEKEAIDFSEQKAKSEDFNPNEPYDVGYRDGLEIGFMKGAELGYNKGLEADKPKWHDMRKNPKDLPNCSHGHTVFNQDLDRVIIRNEIFEFLDGYPANVIAWCEIPKFEE